MIRPENNICRLFIAATEASPGRLAFITPHKEITYGQLQKKVMSAALKFANKGIAKGDYVLVLMPVGIELYCTVLALFYIGACPIFLDDTVTLKTIAQRLAKAPCKAVIASFKWRILGCFIKCLRNIPIKVSAYLQENKANDVPVMASVSNDDTALVTFTTGSTGVAKAANRTHGFLYNQLQALQPHIQPCGHVVACTLPIVMLLNLAQGRTSVIGNIKATKTDIKQDRKYVAFLQKHTVTGLITSPSIAIRLSKYLLSSRQHLPSIQQVLTGGGPVWPEDAEMFLNAFPSAGCKIVFGSTEAEPISCINAKELSSVSPSAIQANGLPVGIIDVVADVKIISLHKQIPHNCSTKELEEACCKNGDTGEIIVSGGHVLSQYINDEKAFAETKIIVDGKLWHRTGDAGCKGDRNQLFLKGRSGRIIGFAGNVWYPFLVEHACRQMEGIICGTLLLLKQQPYLVLQLSKDCHAKQVSNLKKQLGLAGWAVIQVPNIPFDLRHNSKIDYAKLEAICLRKLA